MKKAIIVWNILLIICLMMLPALVIGQDIPPFDDQVEDVPFDGGVSLLIAAGVGYGLKKVHEKRKAEKI